MSSLNYKLAGFLILLGALSGIVFLLAFYLRNFKPESTLGRRIPHLAMELTMSLSGQAMAISVILLGGDEPCAPIPRLPLLVRLDYQLYEALLSVA